MKLEAYIHEHDLTYSSFGSLVGVAGETIRRYCNGARIPQPDVMQKISGVTRRKVTPNDFYEQTP